MPAAFKTIASLTARISDLEARLDAQGQVHPFYEDPEAYIRQMCERAGMEPIDVPAGEIQ